MQAVQVKLESRCVSSSSVMVCGSLQDEILLPFLFNLHMNDLSGQLGSCKTGCVLYMQMIWLFSSCTIALQLLHIHSQYGADLDISLNAKSVI